MADVAGMQDEFRLLGKSIDLIYRGLQCCDHVGIGRLIEPHVAVADLHKTELPHFVGLRFRSHVKGERSRSQHTAFNHAECSCARPSHAFQKSSTVNSVLMVVMLDEAIGIRV